MQDNVSSNVGSTAGQQGGFSLNQDPSDPEVVNQIRRLFPDPQGILDMMKTFRENQSAKDGGSGSPTIPFGFNPNQNFSDPSIIESFQNSFPNFSLETITMLLPKAQVQAQAQGDVGAGPVGKDTMASTSDLSVYLNNISALFSSDAPPPANPRLLPGEPVTMGSSENLQVQKWLDNATGVSYFMAMYTMDKLQGVIQAGDRFRDGLMALQSASAASAISQDQQQEYNLEAQELVNNGINSLMQAGMQFASAGVTAVTPFMARSSALKEIEENKTNPTFNQEKLDNALQQKDDLKTDLNKNERYVELNDKVEASTEYQTAVKSALKKKEDLIKQFKESKIETDIKALEKKTLLRTYGADKYDKIAQSRKAELERHTEKYGEERPGNIRLTDEEQKSLSPAEKAKYDAYLQKSKELEEAHADLLKVAPSKLTSKEFKEYMRIKKVNDTKLARIDKKIERYSPGFSQAEAWKAKTNYQFKDETSEAEFGAKIKDKVEAYKLYQNPMKLNELVQQKIQLYNSMTTSWSQANTSITQAVTDFQNAQLKIQEGQIQAAITLLQNYKDLLGRARDDLTAEIKNALSEVDQIVQRYSQYLQAYFASFKWNFRG